MKERYRQARMHKYARLHGLGSADSPDAIPEADDEIEGALTVSELDSLNVSDSSPDDLTADTLIGDPREEKPPPDEDDGELRTPRHAWLHRRPRAPGGRSRHL